MLTIRYSLYHIAYIWYKSANRDVMFELNRLTRDDNRDVNFTVESVRYKIRDNITDSKLMIYKSEILLS